MSRRRALLRSLAVAGALVCASPPVLAQQIRSFDEIARPAATPADGFRRTARIEPLPPELLQDLLRELLGSWNRPELESKLGDRFFDRRRLLDTIVADAPRDAELRIMALQSPSVVGQRVKVDERGLRITKHEVSAIARIQLEFSDAGGFQRLEGTTEFVFEVTTQSGEPPRTQEDRGDRP